MLLFGGYWRPSHAGIWPRSKIYEYHFDEDEWTLKKAEIHLTAGAARTAMGVFV